MCKSLPVEPDASGPAPGARRPELYVVVFDTHAFLDSSLNALNTLATQGAKLPRVVHQSVCYLQRQYRLHVSIYHHAPLQTRAPALLLAHLSSAIVLFYSGLFPMYLL